MQMCACINVIYKRLCFPNMLAKGAKGVVLHIPVQDVAVHASLPLCAVFYKEIRETA